MEIQKEMEKEGRPKLQRKNSSKKFFRESVARGEECSALEWGKDPNGGITNDSLYIIESIFGKGHGTKGGGGGGGGFWNTARDRCLGSRRCGGCRCSYFGRILPAIATFLLVTAVIIAVTFGINKKEGGGEGTMEKTPGTTNAAAGDILPSSTAGPDKEQDEEVNSYLSLPFTSSLLQIDSLLEGTDVFANYIVQWGMETNGGCSHVIWPTLELSCGEESAVDSVIQVLGYSLPHGYNDTNQTWNDDDQLPLIECQRMSNYSMHCDMKHYQVSDTILPQTNNNTQNHNSSSPSSSSPSSLLYGTLFVVCGARVDEGQGGQGGTTVANKDEEEATSPPLARNLHLNSRISNGTYATECHQPSSTIPPPHSDDEDENQSNQRSETVATKTTTKTTTTTTTTTETSHGGLAMPWISMALLCLHHSNHGHHNHNHTHHNHTKIQHNHTRAHHHHTSNHGHHNHTANNTAHHHTGNHTVNHTVNHDHNNTLLLRRHLQTRRITTTTTTTTTSATTATKHSRRLTRFPSDRSRRATDTTMNTTRTNNQSEDTFHGSIQVYVESFCEQGDRWTAGTLISNRNNETTTTTTTSTTNRVFCLQQSASNCTGTEACSIASDMIVADSVQVYDFSDATTTTKTTTTTTTTADDNNNKDKAAKKATPESCFLSNVLPFQSMVALVAEWTDPIPTLDTTTTTTRKET